MTISYTSIVLEGEPWPDELLVEFFGPDWQLPDNIQKYQTPKLPFWDYLKVHGPLTTSEVPKKYRISYNGLNLYQFYRQHGCDLRMVYLVSPDSVMPMSKLYFRPDQEEEARKWLVEFYRGRGTPKTEGEIDDLLYSA